MPTNEEINGRLRNIIDDGFQHFNKELNTFHGNPGIGTNTISIFLTRVQQYAMLHWGYEHVVKSLGTADAGLISRVAEIRRIIDGQAQQVQNLLNQYRTLQTQFVPQPSPSAQSVMADVERHRMPIQAEVHAKRQQMFASTNRLRELVQGGVPYLQAEIIAKQETGYRG